MAILLPTAAHSEEAVWVDETCQATVEMNGGAYVISTTDESYAASCSNDAGVQSGKPAQLVCDDGTRPTVKGASDHIELQGPALLSDSATTTTLYKKGDQRILCD